MNTKKNSVFVLLVFFLRRQLWFVTCQNIETPANGLEKMNFESMDGFAPSTLADMSKLRRFIVCNDISEELCPVKMNISGYQCSMTEKEKRDVLLPNKGRTPTQKKMEIEVTKKMKSASETSRRSGKTSKKTKKIKEVSKTKTESNSKTCKEGGPCQANCTSGSCRCKPGLHYHAEKKLCFKACKKYGTEIVVYDGISINEHNDRSVLGITKEECAKTCLKATDFSCTTFDYQGLFGMFSMCYISKSTYFTVPLEDRETVIGWVLGTRNCIE